MSKKNYKITFVTFDKISKNKVSSKLYKFDKNIEVVTPEIKIKSHKRYLKYFFCFFLLLKYLYNKKYLLVSFQSNVLAILAAKLTNSKIVIRCNTAPSKYITNLIKKFSLRLYIRNQTKY